MNTDEERVYALVLGKVVGELRKQAQVSQEQFAEKVGASQPTLSRIERGTTLPDALQHRKIAAALGLTETELNARVDQAMERTREAAEGALNDKKGGWKTVLGVAGLVGLGGLAGFAVSALLKTWEFQEEKQTHRPKKKKGSSR